MIADASRFMETEQLSSRISQIAIQILKLVLFRRLRNPWMLAILLLVFAGLSGSFASIGVPYLFWHDNIFARMFGLLGVGIFIEEWVYVAVLLDNDDKNPAKRAASVSNIDSRLPASQYVEETLQIVKEARANSSEQQTPGQEFFSHTRKLHTYASFALCVFVSVASYSIFSWNDLPTTSYYWNHIYMLFSGVYFSMTGAFLAFLIRKLLNQMFEDSGSWASWLFSKFSFVVEAEKDVDPEFKRLHQIAFGKNVCFGFILFAFCVAYWSFRAPPRTTVPTSLAIGFVGLLIYLCLLLKTKKGTKGRSVSMVFTIIHLIVFPLLYVLHFEDVATSVALIGSVLLTLTVGFFGWVVFQSRRPWFEFVVVGGLIVAGYSYYNFYRIPQVVQMYGSEKATISTTADALAVVALSAGREIENEHQGWLSQFDVGQEPDTKPVLVVIANSGGGIKAQVWSSIVIQALEKTINEHLDETEKQTRFNQHVRLVTGTSGGMVGASHWVGSFESINTKKDSLSPEDMVYAMTRDALDDVSRQMFYNDLIAFPYNIARWREPRPDARGKALEAAFEAHSSVFTKTMASLKEGEDEGWRPILAFAPTIAEDGRRFLISNQPIEYTLVSDIPTIMNNRGKPATSSIAGYSWRVNFPSYDGKRMNTLKLSQAARLTANFPVFVDSPKLPFDPPLRIMDAGYVDNYGGAIASQWLHHNLGWLKENTGKILYVQISASPLEREISLAGETLAAPEASGFVNASFNKTLHHTDMALARFANRYDQGSRTCKMVTFEYEGDAALTWYLSNKEKFTLLYPFLSNELIKQLGGNDTDKISLKPFEIPENKPLKKIVGWEGKRFVERVELADQRRDTSNEEQEKDDRKYLKQKESRLLIRKKLNAVKEWWD